MMSIIGGAIWRQPMMIIAAKEFKDSLRNRWVAVIFGLFFLLSFSVTFAGSAVSGTLAFPSLVSVIASLSTIAVAIIPLAAILLCYDAFVGEDESGTMLLLLSYPLTKMDIFLGKLLAHSGIMLAAIVSSFTMSAIILCCFGQDYQWLQTLWVFGQFIASSSLLALIFILLSYVVSLRATEKAKAVGILLSLWFALVLIYDLLLLALLVADLGPRVQWLVQLLMALNPTDIYRAINQLATHAPMGSLPLLSQFQGGELWLYGLMLLWTGLLAWLTLRTFERKAI